MSLRWVLLLACSLPISCAVSPAPDTARLPPNAFGTYADGDIGAINLAQWAFASPARTRNDPIDAARSSRLSSIRGGSYSRSPLTGDQPPTDRHGDDLRVG